jgi:hypothetical protein
MDDPTTETPNPKPPLPRRRRQRTLLATMSVGLAALGFAFSVNGKANRANACVDVLYCDWCAEVLRDADAECRIGDDGYGPCLYSRGLCFYFDQRP